MFLDDEISTKAIRNRLNAGIYWIALTALAAFILLAIGFWTSAHAAANPSDEGLVTPSDCR
jgi:hypothetical protein